MDLPRPEGRSGPRVSAVVSAAVSAVVSAPRPCSPGMPQASGPRGGLRRPRQSRRRTRSGRPGRPRRAPRTGTSRATGGATGRTTGGPARDAANAAGHVPEVRPSAGPTTLRRTRSGRPARPGKRPRTSRSGGRSRARSGGRNAPRAPRRKPAGQRPEVRSAGAATVPAAGAQRTTAAPPPVISSPPGRSLEQDETLPQGSLGAQSEPPPGLAHAAESAARGLAQPPSSSVVRVRLDDAQTRELLVRGRAADDEKHASGGPDSGMPGRAER